MAAQFQGFYACGVSGGWLIGYLPKINDLKVFNDFKVEGARAYSLVGRSRFYAYGVSVG